MTRDEVMRILDELPAGARAELRGTRILLKPTADDEDRKRGVTSQVAYFWGSRPMDDDGVPGALPSADGARGDVVILLDRVPAGGFRRVLLHELGHVLGYDEDDLEAMGLGGR